MFETKLSESINRLEQWIIDHDYKGYEPFDGLSSALRPLTFGNLLAERILQQAIRQSPVNLRPLFGVRPLDSTKGRGYIAWAFLTLFRSTGDEKYRQRAVECLDWLIENKSPLYSEFSWGNHFDYSARGGRIPIHEPTIVWTGLIGQVFLDAYRLLNDKKYLDVADSICRWITGLGRERTDHGLCISYVTYMQSSIHNSNMIGAAMLARFGNYLNNQDYLELAGEAMRYSCHGQLKDGAWYYGDAEKYHWIDNFHTGYNLDSLKRYIEHTGDHRFNENLERGFHYFKDHFFEASGRPKYYHNRAYPIDIQCAAQAIETLLFFSDMDNSAVDLAQRVAQWTVDNMQDKSGYFYYRILPIKKVKIPMIHWGQATMFKALACMTAELNKAPETT